MVEDNHNIVSFNSDTLIKGDHGVLVAVYVSKVGTAVIRLNSEMVQLQVQRL